MHAQPVLQMEVYETEIMVYTAKMVNLTGEIEKMEKDPEAFNEAYIESIKVQIKQVEALMVEVQSSFLGSSAVFMSIRETVSLMKISCLKIRSLKVVPKVVRLFQKTISRVEKLIVMINIILIIIIMTKASFFTFLRLHIQSSP